MDGGGGNDTLIGGNHNDTLFGATGRDLLMGGWGDDELTGGRLGDVFQFDAGDGNDVIRDYGFGNDKIDVVAFAFASVADVLATGQQVGEDVLFQLDAETSVTILGQDLTTFNATDFILA